MIQFHPLMLTAHAQRMLCFWSRIMISESEISKGYGVWAPYTVANKKTMLLAVTMTYILFCCEISYKGSNEKLSDW